MGKRRDQEGNIREVRPGLWQGRVQLGGKRISLYGATQAEALAKVRASVKAHKSNRPVLPDRATVSTLLDSWLAIAKDTTRPRTYESYELTARLHLKPALGTVPVVKLTTEDCEGLVTKLVRKPCGGKGREGTKLSARSVEYALALLVRALNLAVERGTIERNPALKVKTPTAATGGRQYLDLAQARKLLDTVKGDPLEALYAVAVAAGLRKGEALGLRWSDVDLKSGEVVIRNQLQRVRRDLATPPEEGAKLPKTALALSTPKTDKGRRALTLPTFAVEALRLHRKAQDDRALKLGDKWKTTGYVFTSGIGTPIEPRRVSTHFAALLDRAELPPMPFHSLRHTSASLLMAQGASPKLVMELLGHSRISMTMDVYTHVMPAQKAEAARLMNKALGRR